MLGLPSENALTVKGMVQTNLAGRCVESMLCQSTKISSDAILEKELVGPVHISVVSYFDRVPNLGNRHCLECCRRRSDPHCT